MSLRAPGPADLDAVLEVIIARDVVDLGVPDYTRADLENDWLRAGEALARDARVAEHGGCVRGYATVRANDAQVIVHPQATGRGLGSALLAWSEARERELGRDRHRRDTAATDAAGHALLTANGYAPTRSFWRLAVDLPRPVRAGAPPAGIEVRALDPHDDAVAVHALDELAFAANADYAPQTLDSFRERHLASSDSDLSLVAHLGAALVGFVITHRLAEEDSGYVAILAVHPDHRRLGLGRALLSRAFERVATAGLGTAQLSVASDNPRAFALYESLGMSVRFQVDSYEKSARHAPRAVTRSVGRGARRPLAS